MEGVLLKVVDSIVPNSVKWDVKEICRSVEYYKNRLFQNGYEVFSRIDVETNTDCNRSCKICPISESTRPCGIMPLDLYEVLLGQLSEIDFKGRLSPVFYNEPLMDDRLPDLMKMARNVLPDVRLTIYTNGSLLTNDLITALLESGLDGMIISQYQENLPEDDVRELISDLPNDAKRRFRYRIMTDDLPLSTRGGLVEVKKPVKKKFCYQASTDAVVDYEGNVLLCCNDFNAEHVFGNIRDDHIIDIWNRREFKEVRRQLRRGVFKEEICKACSGNNSNAKY